MEQSKLSPEYWATLDRFRAAVDVMFQTDILSDPALLSGYDQVMAAGREAMEARGIDLDQEEQRYLVACVIQWTLNIVTGLVAKNACVDEHMLSHLRSAISWPSYLVREITLDLPNPTIFEESTDGV